MAIIAVQLCPSIKGGLVSSSATHCPQSLEDPMVVGMTVAAIERRFIGLSGSAIFSILASTAMSMLY